MELSHDTISKITDAVLEEVKAWQTRPLEELYPILYLDALVVKVRDGHQVRNRAAHIAVGVDLDGVKHVLGIWVQASEGAKFWAGVCAELRNRGVRDVLIVCCDGLTGFPEAIEATWPQTTVQTCMVHLIRAAMRFVSYERPQEGRRRAAADLHRPHRGGRRERAAGLRRLPARPQVPGHRARPGRTPGRVAPARYRAGAPSEPDVRRCPRIRLKQAPRCRGWAEVLGCRVWRAAGRSQRERGAASGDRLTRRVPRTVSAFGGSPCGSR